MSSTRVELRISFTVSSDPAEGRQDAERAIRMIEWLGKAHLRSNCADFEVAKGPVNGNAWSDRWPDAEPSATCGAHSSWSHWGNALGPCVKTPDHSGEWHEDANGAQWDPAKWDRA